jgi:hypothetical protein
MLFKEPTPSASKNPTPTTSKKENSQNNVEINDGSEVVTESNSSGCTPIQENLIEKVTETRDCKNQSSDFNKEALAVTKKDTFKKKPVKSNEELASNKNNSDETNQTKGLSATKKATFKKKPVESNEELASNKNNANGDDKTNQTKQKVQAFEATSSSAQPKKRFSFKLGTIYILRK